ncbi:MAG: hypothetical protein ACO2ON_00980 [Candidatus Nanopusillus sp.]
MNKDILKELRIGSYLAITYYISVLILFILLMYTKPVGFTEIPMLIVGFFMIFGMFFIHMFITSILKDIIEILLNEINDLKAKIENNNK